MTRHKPEPDGPNWYTVRQSEYSAWRAACKHCERTVRYNAHRDAWEHVR